MPWTRRSSWLPALLQLIGCDPDKEPAVGDTADSPTDSATETGVDSAEDSAEDTSDTQDTANVNPLCPWLGGVPVADVKICSDDGYYAYDVWSGMGLTLNDGYVFAFLYDYAGSEGEGSAMGAFPLPLAAGTYYAPESPMTYANDFGQKIWTVNTGDLLASREGDELLFGRLSDYYLYLLPATSGTATISDGQAIYYSGFAADRAVGDLNGDGQDDVATSSGCLSVTWGPLDGLTEPEDAVSLACSTDGGWAADSLLISDLDGDGFEELAYASGNDDGPLFVLQGPLVDGDSWDWHVNVTAYGGGHYDRVRAPTARDVDRDGYNDLLLAAPYRQDATGETTGGYYLFRGPLQADESGATADATLTGPGRGCTSGREAGLAGDLTGDGTEDLVAMWYDEDRYGCWLGVYDATWLGTATYEDPTWTFEGESDDGAFEVRYSGALGDVSGDGVADLFVNGWADEKLVGYVIFGH